MSKTNKGLGRGIDALFKDFSEIEEVDIKKETVVEIPLEELRPNPYQPRKTFDEKALEEFNIDLKNNSYSNKEIQLMKEKVDNIPKVIKLDYEQFMDNFRSIVGYFDKKKNKH